MIKEYVIECHPLAYPDYLANLRKSFDKNEFVKTTQHDGNFHYVTTAFYFSESD